MTTNNQELAQRIEAARRAFAKLQRHHVEWILSAARSHFLAEIERCELEIMRHRAFESVPPPEPFLRSEYERKTRADLIDRAEESLAAYRPIVEFLNLADHALGLASAIGLASEIAIEFRKSGMGTAPLRKKAER